MKITVVGSGYVGLVAGACFADLGHEVIIVDNDREKLAALKGAVPIHEPFLPELLQRHRGERLRAAVKQRVFVSGGSDLLAQPLSSCRLGHRETVHFGDGSRSRQALRPVLFSQGNPTIPTRAQSRHENIVRKQNLLPATTFDQPSRRQELCSETVQDPRLIKIATTHLHTNNHNAVLPIHLCFSKRLSSVNAGLESRQLRASCATTRARESENIVSGVLPSKKAKLTAI